MNALRRSKVPPPNSALTLPVGVSVMNVEDLGRHMFVRPCYPKIERLIFDEVLHSNTKRFVVMGIPGIGKTTFLYYLLHVLIKKKTCVVFEDFEGDLFIVQENGEVVEVNRREKALKIALAQESTYYLFNCGGSKGTMTPLVKNVRARTVVASSPSIDHTKELRKYGHSIYDMPIWTLDELQLCRRLCHLKLSKNVVSKRFVMWGGSARKTLFPGSDADLEKELSRALAKFKDRPHEVLDSVGGTDTGDVSHMLLHQKVDEQTFKGHSVILASDYIGDRMCDLNLEGVVNHIATLQTDQEEHGLRGRLFEPFAHRVLRLGSSAFSDVDTLMMVSSSTGKRVAVPSITSSAGMQNLNDLDKYSDSEGTYLHPNVSNFPVVDSIVTPRTGYQMTVSTTHSIKNVPFVKLLDKLGCTKKQKFRLVWVVPADVQFNCRSLSSDLQGRVEQFILQLPLRVPPSLKATARARSSKQKRKRTVE